MTDKCRREFEEWVRIAYERDRAMYHEQWSDEDFPITAEEDAAYKAGHGDGCRAAYDKRTKDAEELRNEIADYRYALLRIMQVDEAYSVPGAYGRAGHIAKQALAKWKGE